MPDADRLFAVPLEEFVAERKRLAKELREGGDREAAAEVAKLPKPTPPAWALNQLAREEPDAIGAWLDAAEELRDVSARPSGALREAMAGHREATRTLVSVIRDRARPGGKPLSEPMLERVRELLQAATVDPEVADALRAGRIVEGDEQPSLPGFEVAGGPRARREPAEEREAGAAREPAEERKAAPRESAAERKAAAKAAKDREAERKEREQAERRAELERLISAAEQRAATLQSEADERESAADEADARLEAAQQTLHRAESEAAAARRAADDARDAAATTERELRQLHRQLRNASGAT